MIDSVDPYESRTFLRFEDPEGHVLAEAELVSGSSSVQWVTSEPIHVEAGALVSLVYESETQ